MGLPILSFRKPVITRGGNKVRFYHFYPDEIHGAYETEPGADEWKICRWRMDGYFADPDETGKQYVTSLDLINEVEDEVAAPHAA